LEATDSNLKTATAAAHAPVFTLQELRPMPKRTGSDAVIAQIAARSLFLYCLVIIFSSLLYRSRRRLRACVFYLSSGGLLFFCVKRNDWVSPDHAHRQLIALHRNSKVLVGLLDQGSVTDQNVQTVAERLLQTLDPQAIMQIDELLRSATRRPIFPGSRILPPLGCVAHTELRARLKGGDAAAIGSYLNQKKALFYEPLSKQLPLLRKAEEIWAAHPGGEVDRKTAWRSALISFALTAMAFSPVVRDFRKACACYGLRESW
jgi:hypothetical protein